MFTQSGEELCFNQIGQGWIFLPISERPENKAFPATSPSESQSYRMQSGREVIRQKPETVFSQRKVLAKVGNLLNFKFRTTQDRLIMFPSAKCHMHTIRSRNCSYFTGGIWVKKKMLRTEPYAAFCILTEVMFFPESGGWISPIFLFLKGDLSLLRLHQLSKEKLQKVRLASSSRFRKTYQEDVDQKVAQFMTLNRTVN